MLRARIQFSFYVTGLLLCFLATVMVLPAMVDLAFHNPDTVVFLESSLATFAVGALLAVSNRSERPPTGRAFYYLLTVVSWLALGVFASVPLALSSVKLDLVDIYFEVMSGLTTTGSTVLVGLDGLPPGLLLWRSLLQWFGGIGIIAMAMIVLPALSVGGMQLFRTESSDISGKILPRARQVATVGALVYIGLTVLCAVALRLAGMNGFDAINHAMATLATGGFSTHDASLGHFNSVAIEVVTTAFMAMAALPLIYFARFIIEGRRALARDRQVRAFLITLLAAILIVTLWNAAFNHMTLAVALRHSSFAVTSVLTDTGFVTEDFSAWGSFGTGFMFFLMFVGGCAGSTAGGIKIFRWQIMLGAVRNQLRVTLSPNLVAPLSYNGKPVDTPMLAAVQTFFFLYFLSFSVLSLAGMATGLDFLSASSAVAQAMANVGPGLGQTGGPAGNFAAVPDSAKLLLVLSMLVGRLELVTVYVVLMRDFWD